MNLHYEVADFRTQNHNEYFSHYEAHSSTSFVRLPSDMVLMWLSAGRPSLQESRAAQISHIATLRGSIEL
jgi:hypothetical protein